MAWEIVKEFRKKVPIGLTFGQVILIMSVFQGVTLLGEPNWSKLHLLQDIRNPRCLLLLGAFLWLDVVQ